MLDEFCLRCDGGSLAWFSWYSMSQLAERTREWERSLGDGDWRGDRLNPGRHVVIAEDAGGSPVVWDARTGVVRTFQLDGADRSLRLAPRWRHSWRGS